MPTPCRLHCSCPSHLHSPFASVGRVSITSFVVLILLLMYANSEPEAYCVNEYHLSPSWMLVLECITTAEGMSAVMPVGNSMTSCSSSTTRCPPVAGSKLPSAIMQHIPNNNFLASRWGVQTVLGPRLKDANGRLLVKGKASCFFSQCNASIECQ